MSARTWVGVDASRAAPRLRAAVEAGARRLRVAGPRTGGAPAVRFHSVAAASWNPSGLWLEIMRFAPLDRLGLGQCRLEQRPHFDASRLTTGLEWWLVVEGDLPGAA